MTIEITLRPSFTFPRVLQARKKEPSRAHWVGQGPATKQDNAVNQEPPKNDFQDGENEQGNNSLSVISLSDVDNVLKTFKHQLKPAGDNWIAINHFCTLPLTDKGDGRPPMIFGRVKTAFPSDGHLENVEQLALQFPYPGRKPQSLRIHRDDISRYSTVHAQDFHIRVQVKAFEDVSVEFDGLERVFSNLGFSPDFNSEFYDLLDMNDQNQSEYPWLYVIDSRWFSSISESLFYEITGKLKEMLNWGKTIINYHPRWLAQDIPSLNDVLELKYRLTKHYLTQPGTSKETADVISILFDERFDQGLFG